MDIGHLLVTGSMRSGTTYVGRVLAHCPSLTYIHEPFNYVRGIEGVEHWLPYEEAERGNATYANLIDRFMAREVTYKNPSRDPVWRQWLRAMVGSRPAWRLWLYDWLLYRTTSMLVKDPTAVFLSDYMVRAHGARVLLMVRHPMAFYYSNKRLSWDFDLSEIASQKSLVDSYLTDEDVDLLNTDNLPYTARIAILWRIIYRVAGHFEDLHRVRDGEDQRWMTCRHEDVCRNPQEQFEKITQTFGLEKTEGMLRFICSSSGSDNPTSAEDGQAHQLRRNANRLATYWKAKVTAEERDQVRELTSPIAARYYDEESWKINTASHEK